MKDDFGNTKPVQIELNERWFNGSIIVRQEDFRLPTWISIEIFRTLINLNLLTNNGFMLKIYNYPNCILRIGIEN